MRARVSLRGNEVWKGVILFFRLVVNAMPERVATMAANEHLFRWYLPLWEPSLIPLSRSSARRRLIALYGLVKKNLDSYAIIAYESRFFYWDFSIIESWNTVRFESQSRIQNPICYSLKFHNYNTSFVNCSNEYDVNKIENDHNKCKTNWYSVWRVRKWLSLNASLFLVVDCSHQDIAFRLASQLGWGKRLTEWKKEIIHAPFK